MNQLSTYLQNTYTSNYITGTADCNLLVWGSKGEMEHTVKLCSLNIGFEYDPFSVDKDQAENYIGSLKERSKVYNKLFEYGSKFSDIIGIPFIIIVYPCLRKEFNNNWELSRQNYPEGDVMFYCKNITDGDQFVCSGKELRSKINYYLQIEALDEGTIKDKNKRISDYFHMWSRDFLSKSISKFDVDGFIINDEIGKAALIEFKRSNTPPIPFWYPEYDRPDYKLQLLFAQKIGADFWLLHHEDTECDPETNISFFKIESVTNEEYSYVKSSFRAMKLPLQGNNSLDTMISRFIQSGDIGSYNDGRDNLYCPLCGSLILSGMYGKYCPQKCGMVFGKYLGQELDDSQILDLITGNSIAAVKASGDEITIYPHLTSNQHEGKTYYFWSGSKYCHNCLQ